MSAANDRSRRHTPGPWIASGCPNIWAGEKMIANLCEGPGAVTDFDELTANADLIAAAPQMLKALKTIVRQMEGKHPVGHDAFIAAKRAIREAEPEVWVGSESNGRRRRRM